MLIWVTRGYLSVFKYKSYATIFIFITVPHFAWNIVHKNNRTLLQNFAKYFFVNACEKKNEIEFINELGMLKKTPEAEENVEWVLNYSTQNFNDKDNLKLEKNFIQFDEPSSPEERNV